MIGFLFTVFIILSWYVQPLFSLICFIPYFFVLFAKKNRLLYLKLYGLNLLWNTSVTFWLCEINWIKGVLTILINSFLFLLPIIAWKLITKYLKIVVLDKCLLLLLWILFEYSHHLWDFSWTWLTVGNVFGKSPHYILWYRYIGVLGGSMWILLCNYFLYKIFLASSFGFKVFIRPLLLIILPMLLSLSLFYFLNKRQISPKINVAVISTVIRNDSISDINKLNQIDTLFKRNSSSYQADITILPETTISNDVWFGAFSQTRVFWELKNALHKWTTKNIILGVLLKVQNDKGGYKTDDGFFQRKYNQYNAAFLLNKTDDISVKLKKVYVPIEEYIPSYLSFLAGGKLGFSKGEDNDDRFIIGGHSYFICICYEAVNSIFIAQGLNRDDNALIMLSSENFFGKSKLGRDQYKNITRLRSVENGISLIKSSNDGTSFTCDALGQMSNFYRVRELSKFSSTIFLSSSSCYHKIAHFLSTIILLGIFFIFLINIIVTFTNSKFLKKIFNAINYNI